MQTNKCCICDAATLLHRQNLRTLAVMAGVFDALLRQFAAQQQCSKPGAHESWTQLGDLIALAGESDSVLAEGVAQGIELANNVEKHWLGDYDSLCLNCGFLLTGASED
tara:strand:+ start:8872 stop:9198 length:327 start_codon:yes stop_codon:yes gene_type:complete